MSDQPPIQRVLVIHAHPDDPEFSAGGTIARWTSEGLDVSYCIVTDGSKGTDDRSITRDQLVALRVQEQQAAAEVLGVRNILWLGFPDGEVVPDLNLRQALVKVIRQVRPERIICPDPTTLITSFNTINHPDHRAVGLATLDAIFPAARNHNYFDALLGEGLEPMYVREVYLSGSLNPDVWVDITATFERKLAALRCHVSQIRDMEGLAQRMRDRMQKRDIETTDPVYVEGFRKLKL